MNSTKQKRPTYYEELRQKGYSRRDLMKCCTIITAFLADNILDKIFLDYPETQMAASGHQAEAAMEKTMKDNYGEYILCVEGSVPTAEEGVYCCIGGKSAQDILQEAVAGAKAIIAWGSCACNGCVQSARPNSTHATPIHKLVKNKPNLKVPGCPPIGEVMAGVIVHVVTFGTIPELDSIGRPKAFYSKRVHDSCYRRPFYDAGLFVESFDDENARNWGSIGGGLGNYMVYGDLSINGYRDSSNYKFPSGAILNKNINEVFDIDLRDDTQVQEFVANSWYEYSVGDDAGLHPWKGETKLNYNGPKPPYDYLNVEDKYSFLKTPRWKGILRTVHSFDPCMACAVHVYDEDGKHVSQVKVL